MVKSVEKAVALDARAAAAAKAAFIKRYDVVYAGSEFCQNLLPSKAEVAALFGKGARKVALLTPFLTMERLKEAQDILSDIVGEFRDIEVLVNDFGLLAYLNKFHPRTVKGVGRPLSIDFLRMDPKFRAKFFREQKLGRLETDELDLLRGLPAKPGFRISLHYPYKFAAMTRLCPYVGKIAPACGRRCLGKKMRLPVPGGCGELVSLNNAYFTEYKPGRPANVDRFVDHSCGAGKAAS